MKDNKEKNKIKKEIKIMSSIFIILIILTMAFLIYSIYLISGIETEIRYFVMILTLIVNIVLILLLRKLIRKNTLAKYIIFIIISFILIGIQGVLGYFIFKTYSSLDNMNKDKITYTSAIVTLKDSKYDNVNSLKDIKIGIINDTTSIDGYILGKEIIKEYNLESKNTIVECETFTELIKELYDKKIEAIIISSNYPSMFKSIKEYENVETETEIIYEKSKKYTKNEIAKISGEETTSFNTSNKIDKPFTMLVMGIDSPAETLNKNAAGNGDALMLVTFNPKTLNATILSIPRDTYVSIPCSGFNGKENKITHAAWQGESCMIKTIENFTGISIDYYVKINFKGVIKLVDALGGIEVDVPKDFCESNSNRSTKKENLVCLEKGVHTINGEQALALARHRKTLATGDFQRGLNQQEVVKGILNKAKTIRSAGQALEILDAISKNMDTNFTTKQILSFYEIFKNIILTSSESSNLISMQQLYLSGSSQMIYDESIKLVLYNYIPNKSSLKQIVSAMKQNLGQDKTDMIKTMDFNIEEEYESKMIGTDNLSATSTYSLLTNLVGKTKASAESWLNSNGVSYKIDYQTITDGSYQDGIVISQSFPANKRIDLINGEVTIVVAKVENTYTTPDISDTDTSTDTDTDSDTSGDSSSSTDSGGTDSTDKDTGESNTEETEE